MKVEQRVFSNLVDEQVGKVLLALVAGNFRDGLYEAMDQAVLWRLEVEAGIKEAHEDNR